MQRFAIHQASPADIYGIRGRYAHYVLNSTITFDMSVPDAGEMLARLHKIRAANCAYLACEVDDDIAGYAYSASYQFHLRNGFACCGTLKSVGQTFEHAIDTYDTHFFQKAL